MAGLAPARRPRRRTPRSRTRRGSGGARSSSSTRSRSYRRELLHEAVDRRAGWPARERRRAGRGRRRNLTAILRRARLTKAQRRARGVARRRELARHAERQRVRAQVAQSLADAAKTHVTHPFGASTTSRSSLEEVSQDETFNRRLTGARARRLRDRHRPPNVNDRHRERTGPERGGASLGGLQRGQGAAVRCDRRGVGAVPALAGRRVDELLDWPETGRCPRWRLIEAWTVAAHGPVMAAAGGFRLAFWSEDRAHHGAAA